MKKITPFLWFNDNALEAAKFYTTVFKNSKITGTVGPEGSEMGVTFELDGQDFFALNGGPQFHFTEAISFYISCETQEDVDYYWNTLLEGGEESQCGWLKDKYGLSWQVVPQILSTYLGDSDPARAKKVFDAMMQMRKIDIAKLEEAYNHA